MIVCHCCRITDRDIRHAIGWMRAADPETVITPGKLYRALGRRPECGGCMPRFLDVMRRDQNTAVPAELLGLRDTLPGAATRADSAE